MTSTADTAPQERTGLLPDGWRWVRLDNVLRSLETGSRPIGGAIGVSEGIPSLSAEHITRNGTFNYEMIRYVPRDFFNGMSRGHICINDILIVKDGATTGKAAFVEEAFPFAEAVVNEHVFLCRPEPSIVVPRYLFYWLWGPTGQSAIRSNFQGSAIGGINQSFVETVSVPLPPLPEQNRIAAILKEQMAAVEWARAAAEAQLEAAKALPAAYLRGVFGTLGPQVCAQKRLGDVCGFVGGTQPPKGLFRYQPLRGYVRLVQIQDFRRSDLAVYIREEDAGRRFDETDVMIGRYGPPVFQILRGLSGAYNVALMKTVPKEGLSKDYLYYLLQEPRIQNAVISQSRRAAGQSGVQKEFLEEFTVPVPLLSEQRNIAARLSEQMADAERTRQALEAQLATINALPAALLRRAFNGEL